MTLKTITHPSGRTFKMGRTKPPADLDNWPKLHLRNYLLDTLPAPPRVCHYSRQAEHSLSQVFENDRLGCCEIAGPAHAIGVFNGNAGAPIPIFTDTQITAIYSAVGGYVPGKPDTDQGCDTLTMFDYWQKTGFDGHKIAGFMAIDPGNIEHLKLAIHLFENLCFGVDLPDEWVNGLMPTKSGFQWPVAGPPVDSNGHFFPGFGYNDNGVDICSWGIMGQITYPAIAKYASKSAQGELYTVVSQEILNRATHKAPAGLDWQGLAADFAQLGGTLT